MDRKKQIRLISPIIISALFLIAGMSTPQYGITWDEPNSYFAGVKQIDNWIAAIHKEINAGNFKGIFSKEFTRTFWQAPTHATYVTNFYNNHPPLPRIAGYVTWQLFSGLVNDVVAMRLAACLIFALTGWAVFLWGCDRSLFTGLLGVLFLTTLPRLFAFAHFLTTDIFLAAFWIFISFAFYRAARSGRSPWFALGWLLFGAAINIKFTALIIPIPIFLFFLIRHRSLLRKWLYFSPFCAVFAFLLNPTWWHNPIETFLQSHLFLSLFRTSFVNFTVLYFGRITNEVPWHYPIVLIFITTPVILLLLSGGALAMRLYRSKGWNLVEFAMIHILVLTGIACLPNAPRYDGIRLMLPVLPFIAMLSALSCTAFLEKLRDTLEQERTGLGILGCGLVLLAMSSWQISRVIHYHPFQLSYYNEAVGGIRGAYERGFEATYWLEAVTPAFIKRINHLLPKNATLSVHPGDPAILAYFRQIKLLRPDIRIMAARPDGLPDYLILVNRYGTLLPRNYKGKAFELDSVSIDGVPLVSFLPTRR